MTEPQNPNTFGVLITPAEMWAELRQITTGLGELGHDTKTMLGKITDLQAETAKKADLEKVTTLAALVDKHEARLDGIDRRLWIATGIAAAVGGGLAKFLPLIGA